MNAFDLIVTVALGSTLATILLSKDVALAVLIGLQFAIIWASVRARWVRRLVTGEPTLLVFRGERLHEALRRVRVNGDELCAARTAGLASPADAHAIVLRPTARLV